MSCRNRIGFILLSRYKPTFKDKFDTVSDNRLDETNDPCIDANKDEPNIAACIEVIKGCINMLYFT